MTADISFLLPTRKRLEPLLKTLRSLEITADDLTSFEVIVIFDEDDSDTFEKFSAFSFPFSVQKIVSHRHGYDRLHHYYNNACQMAIGNWLWIWNDDVVMVSEGWDTVIKSYTNKFVIINPKSLNDEWAKYWIDSPFFPIVPRAWFECLGHLSQWNHNDTYINKIGFDLNMIRAEPRITNIHNWLIDEVRDEISYHKISCPIELQNKDYEKIKEFIGKKILISYYFETIPYRIARFYRQDLNKLSRILTFNYLTKVLSLDFLKRKLKKIGLFKK